MIGWNIIQVHQNNELMINIGNPTARLKTDKPLEIQLFCDM